MRRRTVRIFLSDDELKAQNRQREDSSLLRSNRLLFKKVEAALQANHLFREGKGFVKHQNHRELVVFLIFFDAMRLYHSILLLLSRGHVGSAAMLNRMLLERVVDALYITKASKERAGRYLRFWQMNRFRLLIRMNDELDFPKASDKRRMGQLEEAKRFVKQHGRVFRRQHWSSIDVKERCGMTGLNRQYVLSFYEYSSHGHSDPVSSIANIQLYREGVLAAYKGEFTSETYLFHLVATEMAKYLMVLFAIMKKTFMMSLDRSLEEALKKLRANQDFCQCFRANRVLHSVRR